MYEQIMYPRLRSFSTRATRLRKRAFEDEPTATSEQVTEPGPVDRLAPQVTRMAVTSAFHA